MAGQNAKRKFVKRPGLFGAAEALGCTYSHLRRVVIGQRASKSLLRRYHALKSRQGADPAEEISRPDNGHK